MGRDPSHAAKPRPVKTAARSDWDWTVAGGNGRRGPECPAAASPVHRRVCPHSTAGSVHTPLSGLSTSRPCPPPGLSTLHCRACGHSIPPGLSTAVPVHLTPLSTAGCVHISPPVHSFHPSTTLHREPWPRRTDGREGRWQVVDVGCSACGRRPPPESRHSEQEFGLRDRNTDWGSGLRLGVEAASRRELAVSV